jgi:RAT1-interacting protein
MVLAGEVDAIWDEKPTIPNAAPINYIELKTSVQITRPQESIIYEKKLCKFWAQSFLLGVPKIIVGFRSRDGILRSLEEINTVKLPGVVKKLATEQKRRPEWDGDICTNFLEGFLRCKSCSLDENGPN